MGSLFRISKSLTQPPAKRALIEDFTFHDLRHCALNNLRLAGNDYFKMMAIFPGIKPCLYLNGATS
jgi:hypothetical protein